MNMRCLFTRIGSFESMKGSVVEMHQQGDSAILPRVDEERMREGRNDITLL
jgi:hypothetical protein